MKYDEVVTGWRSCGCTMTRVVIAGKLQRWEHGSCPVCVRLEAWPCEIDRLQIPLALSASVPEVTEVTRG